MKTSQSSVEDVILEVAYADSGIGWTLRYDLFLGTEKDRSFYSMRITRTDTGESAFVRDITKDTTLARRIFKVLVRGTVTPCCAFEVVEEILSIAL